MNFISVFYISVFLRTTFASFNFGNVSVPFQLVQTPPTEPDVEEDLFNIIDIDDEASETTEQSRTSSSTTTTSLPITTTSLSSPPDTTTANAIARPKVLTTTMTKAKRELLRENRRRCHKLPKRLISTCRAIVEESLQDTAYLYVVTDESDRKDLYRRMRDQKIAESRGLLQKGDLNCNQLICPTKEKWLEKTLPQDRSTSPWTFCHNYDPDRIPALISIAKCLCTGCMDRNTEGENVNYVSQEVKRHIRVLRKHPAVPDFSLCTDSTKLCWHDTESVAVGCHCMVPIIKA